MKLIDKTPIREYGFVYDERAIKLGLRIDYSAKLARKHYQDCVTNRASEFARIFFNSLRRQRDR